MLDPEVRKLAEGPNFAFMSTLDDEGRPAGHVMWVGADDDHLLINTETGRAKFRYVNKDPRAAVVILDRDNPYHYAEVRGRVVDTITGPDARRHIDELSHKYNNQPYDDAWISTERVILKIAPDRQRVA
jgi:PPOX class probable F420-dependent enzyme